MELEPLYKTERLLAALTELRLDPSLPPTQQRAKSRAKYLEKELELALQEIEQLREELYLMRARVTGLLFHAARRIELTEFGEWLLREEKP